MTEMIHCVCIAIPCLFPIYNSVYDSLFDFHLAWMANPCYPELHVPIWTFVKDWILDTLSDQQFNISISSFKHLVQSRVCVYYIKHLMYFEWRSREYPLGKSFERRSQGHYLGGREQTDETERTTYFLTGAGIARTVSLPEIWVVTVVVELKSHTAPESPKNIASRRVESRIQQSNRIVILSPSLRLLSSAHHCSVSLPSPLRLLNSLY
jgi:hypothetical protein